MEDTLVKHDLYTLPLAIIIAAVMISGSWAYNARHPKTDVSHKQGTALIDRVLPIEGVELPATWGDLGTKLVETGAIDGERFKEIYEQRGRYDGELQTMLEGKMDGHIVINRENADYLLNLLWALGLAQENPILMEGEMMTESGGNAGGFASTGGWTLAQGDAMDHYSAHRFFVLTEQQQTLVDKIARGVYRPCCGNSVHFPDCNHGMAMLGLLELMASQGATEAQMWKAALAVNEYWFPDTYVTIATYLEQQGTPWSEADPQQVLGEGFSSGRGFAAISSKVIRPAGQQQRGGGCSV